MSLRGIEHYASIIVQFHALWEHDYNFLFPAVSNGFRKWQMTTRRSFFAYSLDNRRYMSSTRRAHMNRAMYPLHCLLAQLRTALHSPHRCLSASELCSSQSCHKSDWSDRTRAHQGVSRRSPPSCPHSKDSFCWNPAAALS